MMRNPRWEQLLREPPPEVLAYAEIYDCRKVAVAAFQCDSVCRVGVVYAVTLPVLEDNAASAIVEGCFVVCSKFEYIAKIAASDVLYANLGGTTNIVVLDDCKKVEDILKHCRVSDDKLSYSCIESYSDIARLFT